MSSSSQQGVSRMPYVMWTPMHLLPAPLARKSALWGPRRGMDYSFEDEYDEDAQDSAISKVFGTEAKTDKEMGEWVCLGKDGDGAAEGEKRRCTAQHRLEVGHSSLQGYRVSNEDAHLIAAAPELEDTHAIMAIFDGHAGGGTSKYASQHLVQVLAGTEGYQAYLQRRKAQRKTSKGKQATQEEEDSPEDQELIRKAFTAAMADMDERLRRVQKNKACDQSGSTCVCAFVSPSHVYCAWIGDSRCCIGQKGGKSITLSEDHKPGNPDEYKRVVTAGGFVFDNRVDGQLAMSRAFGDFHLKNNAQLSREEQKVVCTPDFMTHKRSARDRLLLLCCDGVFDVMTNQEAVEAVLNGYDAIKSPEQVHKLAEKLAEDLIDQALEMGSFDNISSIVCLLPGITDKDNNKRQRVVKKNGDNYADSLD